MAETGLPVSYCNMVGRDDWSSTAPPSRSMTPAARFGLQLGGFVERVAIVDYANGRLVGR